RPVARRCRAWGRTPMCARVSRQHTASVDVAVSALVIEGRTALAEGEWAGARRCLERAVALESSGPVLEGLAQALFSLGCYAEAIARGEQAFAAFRRSGDDVDAAMCARFVGY